MTLAPQRRHWTRAEFYRLAELGFFRGQRAERCDGEIVVLSPQNWPHASATDRTYELIRKRFPAGHWVRMQLPLALGEEYDPEPDISVVGGRREDYADHPTSAVLVIEVADTSLAYDTGDKAEMYAAAEIADYWVLDLNHQQLIVYRHPRRLATTGRFAYNQVTTLDVGETINPIAAPNINFQVAEMLQ
jgi:Uma2 family endonuclease